MEPQTLSFPAIEPFQFSITHHPHILPLQINDSHIHDQCEIYINLSGKVSFMVEGHLYPVERGDCIITRPLEYHHCVYREMMPHEHYWILFSSKGNEALLAPFFERPKGIGNRIVPTNKERLLKLCQALEHAASPLDQYTAFFRILQYLQEGTAPKETDLPEEMQKALHSINENFRSPLRMEELAKEHFLSISTMERQFKTHLGVSPMEYLRKKRLSFAASLLAEGATVSKAAAESGFADSSHFIALFKRQFGKTPLQYKKALQNNP